MQSVTELIDTMRGLDDGAVVTDETDEKAYEGVVTHAEYTAPGDETGHLSVGVRVDEDTSETVEIRTSASASRKFPRPELYAGSSGAEDDPLGSVADITTDPSDA
jgi:hypothetical protein